MKQQRIRHIAWPKHMNIHRLRLWLPPLNHESEAVSGKNMTIRIAESGETSELLTGELSDGRQGGSSVLQVPKGSWQFMLGRSFEVAEEYGFEQEGALKIPCDEEDFEHILVRCLASKKNDKKRKV
ncbi:unnamed protein product [Prunus armeniaca]|uniref:Uncharacterized protein n=1 Tax=Prunus armeniaca TaxID=36596 RepID=A0A6J5WW59_PRUAR|nr:unnamed protein product [Prunus armeniaca]